MDRKIIYKHVTGSRLYGTNLPNSDEDFSGVFLPSKKDILGLKKCPTELVHNIKYTNTTKNGKGDIDCKYLSIVQFLNLALQGQSIAVESFFIPKEMQEIKTEQWDLIESCVDKIISRDSIVPFIGFAFAQAYKSEIKGANLRQVRSLIAYLKTSKSKRLVEEIYEKEDHVIIGGIRVDKAIADDRKTIVLRVAGKKYNVGIKVKQFLKSLIKMESKYGTRSEKAAEEGIDYKSLSHAYRMITEAEELLLYKKITFPRPDCDFLKLVRKGDYKVDYREDIVNRIDRLKYEIYPLSQLPIAPDKEAIDELCVNIMAKHIL